MIELIGQVGIPGFIELAILLFVLVLAVVPAILVYWDASRRQADYALLWALAMFFASWTLVGIAVVGLLYYFLVVNDDAK